MIEDLRLLEDGRVLKTDVCVVGSGAAGLALAVELAGSPLQVVMLEAGGETLEPETQALYDVEIAGSPYVGAREGRFRVFGGTTTRWGGQALPLTPGDFEARSWVPNSGWPITYADLQPYYRRAERFLGVGDRNYDTDLFPGFGVEPPPLAREDLHFHYAKWCPEPDLRRVHRRTIERATNLTLLLHANADTITLDDTGGAVVAVSARTLEGKRVQIAARQYVICCGGLETARLLLSNDTQHRNGIGNAHDLVGRYLQDHCGKIVGAVTPRDPKAFQKLLNVRQRKGVKYTVRWSATAELLRREQILNVTSGIAFVPPDDSGFTRMKSAYRRLRRREFGKDLLQDATASLAAAPRILRPMLVYALEGRIEVPNASVVVIVSCEQAARPECRVTLAEARDALGMRKLRIHWNLDDLAWRSFRFFAHLIQRQFADAGLADITLFDWVRDSEGTGKAQLSDNYHQMGTTRMAASPNQGVVDASCRVHGIGNLYIGSSAVFPTGGHSNPALTLIALTIRIADTLRGKSPAS